MDLGVGRKVLIGVGPARHRLIQTYLGHQHQITPPSSTTSERRTVLIGVGPARHRLIQTYLGHQHQITPPSSTTSERRTDVSKLSRVIPPSSAISEGIWF